MVGGPATSWASKLSDEFDQIVSALHANRGGRVAGGTVGVNVGVARAEIDLARRSAQPATVPGLLLRLGREAAQRNRQVVLLVDELQGIDADDATPARW